MPAVLAPAIIGAAGSLAGGMFNAQATQRQNRESQIWSQRMYQRQYDDALAFWRMQNEYNSPQAQMARFKEAGLNPNLVYSQGNPGNAGAINTPDVQQPQFRVPEFGNAVSGATSILSNYMDFEIKQAQYDNLLAQNTGILEDNMLKHAQRENILQNTKRSIFELQRDSDMLQTYYDAQREQLRQMKAQTDVMLSRNEREAAMNASNLREAAERILNMRGQRLDTERAAELKRLDIELKSLGIQPSDPIYMRFLAQYIGKDAVIKGSGNFFEKLDSWGLFRQKPD